MLQAFVIEYQIEIGLVLGPLLIWLSFITPPVK